MIMCAFVPLKPKELTPAIRRPVVGHEVRSVGMTTGRSANGTSGLILRRCRCGGISPLARERTSLSNPATPAADSRWPILVLTDPIARRWSSRRPVP